MRATASRRIGAPLESVWEVIADPSRALSYMSGVTRWEHEEGSPHGLGARYRMLLQVGSAQVGGLIEIVEWEAPREMAWSSVTGVDQRGRFRLRPAPGNSTRVEIRMAYGVAGSGLSGWLAERLAAPTINAHLRRTLRKLERIVEHEQTRRRRAGRGRAAAPAA